MSATARSLTPVRPILRLTTLVMAAGLLLASATTARAACTDRSTAPVLPGIHRLPIDLPLQLLPADKAAGRTDHDADDIVGLWYVVFRTSDGNVWDKGFQQYHADGTEITIDNAVPPAFGNVCIGVWKTDGRTIKLRHVTWNWNPDGTPAGTFLLLSTIKLDRDGDTYEGTFVSDSFDLNNHVIPALHAEGTLKGTRIKVG